MLTASISKASGVDLVLPETADGAAHMGYDSMAGGAPAGVAPTENMMFATCNVLPGGGRPACCDTRGCSIVVGDRTRWMSPAHKS